MQFDEFFITNVMFHVLVTSVGRTCVLKAQPRQPGSSSTAKLSRSLCNIYTLGKNYVRIYIRREIRT